MTVPSLERSRRLAARTAGAIGLGACTVLGTALLGRPGVVPLVTVLVLCAGTLLVSAALGAVTAGRPGLAAAGVVLSVLATAGALLVVQGADIPDAWALAWLACCVLAVAAAHLALLAGLARGGPRTDPLAAVAAALTGAVAVVLLLGLAGTLDRDLVWALTQPLLWLDVVASLVLTVRHTRAWATAQL
jgi:hypothetical protein